MTGIAIEVEAFAAIEVRCDQTGDVAETDDPLGALVAAAALLDDAYLAYSWQGYKPTASFYVNGEAVLRGVPRPAVWRAIGDARKGTK